MVQPVMRVGSILLLVTASLYAMERPVPEQIATTMLATPRARYYVKVLGFLPSRFGISFAQHLIANTPKSALPIALLSYKLHQRRKLQGQHYQLRLLLANNQEVQLTPELSSELVQASATIQNLIQDLEEQIEEIPLPLLTQEQVSALLQYLPITNALSTNNKTLPVLQQEIPEIIGLSSYYLKYTTLQQLKEHLTTQTIPTLCDLIITASYLDIQNSKHTINFIELATHALGDKLVQAPQYQEEYNVISTLPAHVQHMLVSYLIDNSAIRFALCGNSTDVIENTAQILTNPTGYITSISWSPDGKQIASCSWDKTIKIWDTVTGTCIHTLKGHTNEVISVSWSPDGKYIASGSEDNTIRIWDANTGTCIYTLMGHTSYVNSVSWSPDGNYIASGSADNTVRVWDATTGTCIHILTGHAKLIVLVTWSPNGRYIASGSYREIKICDARTGTCIHELIGHNGWVNSVSWSPDGKHIASGSFDTTIKVWDASSGTCIRTFTGHTQGVESVSWSSDNRYIASGCDNIIRIWDAQSGTCIHTLKGHTDWVYSVSWSPDGKYIASGSGDATVKIWKTIDRELESYLKARLSWKQALLLIRIINEYNGHYPVDLVEDRKAFQCYNSLDQQVKHLVEPLLSEQTRTATQTVKNLDRLTRANPVRTSLFGIGLEVGRKHCLRK